MRFLIYPLTFLLVAATAAAMPCSVISGAFFFIRSLLQFVNNEPPFNRYSTGWILTATFFVDAYLVGELMFHCIAGLESLLLLCWCHTWRLLIATAESSHAVEKLSILFWD